MLARWFDTVTGPDARILDPFLGSGTSIEVAMALNAADGGTRHVTGIALDEGGIVTDVLVPRLHHCEGPTASRSRCPARPRPLPLLLHERIAARPSPAAERSQSSREEQAAPTAAA